MYINLWGPHGWIFLHSISYQRDERIIDSAKIKQFIELLGDYIPCPGCSHHFKQNYKSTPNIKFEDAIHNLDLFGDYIVEIHNLVNESKKDPKYPNFSYQQSKDIHINDNSYHNSMLFLSTMIAVYTHNVPISTELIEIKDLYLTDKNKCLQMIENYKLNNPQNTKQYNIINNMFLKKNLVIQFLEANPESRLNIINERQNKLENIKKNEKPDKREINYLEYLINMLMKLDKIKDVNQRIKQEFDNGYNMFFTQQSKIDNIIPLIELFGYLLPHKLDRDAFLTLLQQDEFKLSTFIYSSKDIVMDWLLPFMNTLNKNTNRPFKENLSTIDEKKQYYTEITRMWGKDFGIKKPTPNESGNTQSISQQPQQNQEEQKHKLEKLAAEQRLVEKQQEQEQQRVAKQQEQEQQRVAKQQREEEPQQEEEPRRVEEQRRVDEKQMILEKDKFFKMSLEQQEKYLKSNFNINLNDII